LMQDQPSEGAREDKTDESENRKKAVTISENAEPPRIGF